jgi:hypothetical protein
VNREPNREVDLESYVREWSARLKGGIVPDADTAQFIEEISSSLGWPKIVYVRTAEDAKPKRGSMEAYKDAQANLRLIRAMASDGNQASLSNLLQILIENLEWLEGYSYRDKGNLKAVAGSVSWWPVLLNQRPSKQRQAAEYLNRIGLAKPRRVPRFGQGPRVADYKGSYSTLNLLVVRAGQSASENLRELCAHVAAGDLESAYLLLVLVSQYVAWVETHAIDHSKDVAIIARLAPVWPVMLSRAPRSLRASLKYLENITVGNNAQISLSPKWGSPWRKGRDEGAIATFYARQIRLAVGTARNFFLSYDQRLERNGPLSSAAWAKIPEWVRTAGALAPLTKKSAPQWFKIGWQLLLEHSKGHPERIDQLCRIGEYRKRHYEGRALRTAAANIRDGIKTRICRSLISLSPK